MRSLVFDSSTIISLAMNNLLWILEPLKKQFHGRFIIPGAVRKELIDRPLTSLRFKLSALQVAAEVAKGTLEIYDSKEIDAETRRLLGISNNLFLARRRYVRILHAGEIAVFALAKKLKAEAIVADERILRVLIEDASKLQTLLSIKLNVPVQANQRNFELLEEEAAGLKVFRSTELAVMAYELGLLKPYALPKERRFVQGNLNKTLLEGVLWGLKLKGCSISSEEIVNLLKIEGFTPL